MLARFLALALSGVVISKPLIDKFNSNTQKPCGFFGIAAGGDAIAPMTANVSMLVFLPPVRRLLHWNEKLYDTALLLFDAIGLGIFTVIGVQTAYIATGELNAFLAIFVGVVTGCGGGVMRDVFAGSPPYIFVKHFYATASLLGAVACLLLWNIGQMPAMLIGAAVTLTLRLLAAHYRWSLPKAK